jgi:hypothetical protein
MTTAPNGELRRQDLHLQVQQLVSLRSLQWVPGTSVPHLPNPERMAPDLRYYETLRLPMARLGVVRCSLSFPDTLCCSSGFVSLWVTKGSPEGRELPPSAGRLYLSGRHACT